MKKANAPHAKSSWSVPGLKISSTPDGVVWEGRLNVTKDQEGLDLLSSVVPVVQAFVSSSAEPAFEPFANEADALTLGDLSCENRVDRLQIFGTSKATATDCRDFSQVLALLDRARAILTQEMGKGALPPRIQYAKVDSIDNPFL